MSGQFHTLVMLFIGGETEWALLGNFSLNSMLSLTCIFLGERSQECYEKTKGQKRQKDKKASHLYFSG